MSRITLSEVAADAGVSRATVSMVLNDNPLVAAATRERVRESLARLEYVYDRSAAALRKRQTQAVGMVITQLTNPYFAEFAEGIQAELDEHRMDVLLGVSGEDPARQERVLRSMSERRVDGIVCIPAQGSRAETFEALRMPLLMLARRIDGLEADYVGADNSKGAFSAAEHLISQHGSRRLAFVGGFEDSSARRERLGGFMEAVHRHDMDVSTDRMPTCPPDRRQARAAGARLLAADPTVDAVVCFNDVVAFGVLDAVADAGFQVGSDVRVIGFDDVHDAELARPSLASVAVPAVAAGRGAARMLLTRISQPRTEHESFILPTELKPRETCGCLTEAGA